MSSKIENGEALIASRICHDLAGPISAISNGIELMQMVGADPSGGPEIDLVTDSIENLTERLRLCRIAFGYATAEQQVNLSEMTEMLATLYQSRIKVSWDASESVLSRHSAKILLLSILCLETTIPYGGEIQLAGGGKQWVIRASGEKVALPEVWDMLSGADASPSLTPALCQFYMLPRTLAENGSQIRVEPTDTQIMIQLNLQ